MTTWLAWAAIHLEFIGQSSLRVSVFVQWAWTYLTGQSASRLIVQHRRSLPAQTDTAVAPPGAMGSHR